MPNHELAEFLALFRDEQRYLFIFANTHANRVAVAKTCGRWASDPEMPFGWPDAAVIIGNLRELQARDESSS